MSNKNILTVVILFNLIAISWLYLEINGYYAATRDPYLCMFRLDLQSPVSEQEAQDIKNKLTDVSFCGPYSGSQYVDIKFNSREKAGVFLRGVSMDNPWASIYRLNLDNSDFPQGVPERYKEWIFLSLNYKEKYQLNEGDSITLIDKDFSGIAKKINLEIKGFFTAKNHRHAFVRKEFFNDVCSFKRNVQVPRRNWFYSDKKNKAKNYVKAVVIMTRQHRLSLDDDSVYGKLQEIDANTVKKVDWASSPFLYQMFYDMSQIDKFFIYKSHSPKEARSLIDRVRKVVYGYRIAFVWDEPFEVLINNDLMMAYPYDGIQGIYSWPGYSKSLIVEDEGIQKPISDSYDKKAYYNAFLGNAALIATPDVTVDATLQIGLPESNIKIQIENPVKGKLLFKNKPELKAGFLSYDLFFGLKGLAEGTHTYNPKDNVFYKIKETNKEIYGLRMRVKSIHHLESALSSVEQYGKAYHQLDMVNELLLLQNDKLVAIVLLLLFYVGLNIVFYLERV